MRENTDITRRNFIGTMAAATALVACAKTKKEIVVPPLLDVAPDGPVLKAGLIGCGGRGTGAALDFLKAGPNLQVVALADVFQDRVDSARASILKDAGQEVANGRCYVGFDAYKKVIDSGVDIVLIATPPHFRPAHFAAAVDAKKHVFMEKPVAVDPVGARSIMDTADRAEAFGLKIGTGTQRRHQREYVETYKRIANGAIGRIVAARCYWNQSQLWYRQRQTGWSDMEWMIRDWVNWCWLSGDHIVEQHVHNLDVIHWFTGMHPVKAVGFGARMRRVTGDQYDFFSVDFEMPDGMHVHSMCRQIDGCVDNVSEFIVGTKGSSNCSNTIFKQDSSVAWKYGEPKQEDEKASEEEEKKRISPYVQEHIDLVTAIRNGIPMNEAKNTAISTMAAIMGRISAYTGKEVTWDEMMASDFRLGPTEYSMGRVPMKVQIPVPGEGKV